MKKLTIGITCYPTIGGSGIVATQLGLHLAKLGHEVHFISYEKPVRLAAAKNIFFHKVEINEYELFRYPDYTLPLGVKMAGVHQKYNLDVFHVHYAVPHATAALLATAVLRQGAHSKKIPKIVTTLHGTDITLLARDPNLYSAIKFSIERSDGVTSVSKDLKKDTCRILDTRKHIEIIPNFYDPKAKHPDKQELRKKLGLKPNDFVAIHLSNLRAVKRIQDLLKITASLKKYPNFKLLIVGAGDFSEYQKLAGKLSIKNKLVVVQNITEIENYIPAADIGLYTSETESFGLGILEVLSYGLPVVASNVGGIPEVVNNNKTGLLSPVRNIAAFKKQIVKLIDNPKLLEKLGAAAALEAQEKFSSSKVVGNYLDFYYKTLKAKN